ncbi:unnamed protein product [Clonostachys byssicola]|uniref:Zn(2)-C6 fungal-type domain-containing protein n=1 Tax=Clonostachys byssicola TaxID=160290 RepID=A0A9N9XUC4_9HYPO|nr:unnamed protein product [Clonostachys byssicola]
MSTAKSKLKSRSGCARCKQRRVKCDETVPNCLNCLRGGANCPGYRRSVKWSGKHEVLRSRIRNPAAGDSMEPFWNVFEEEASRLHAALVAEAASRDTETVSSSPGSIVSEPVGSILNQEHGIFGTGLSEINATSELVPPDDTMGWLGWVGEQYGAELPTTTSLGHSSDSTDYTQSFDIDVETCEPNPENELIHGISPPSYSLSSITSREDYLASYYFSLVCVINSGFDSPQNPFRMVVASMIWTHPLILNCMLSMSAAHLYQRQNVSSTEALQHRTTAISALSSEISEPSSKNQSGSEPDFITALLGTILLGTTSSWHDASSTDTSFLFGARALLKQLTLNSDSAPERSFTTDGCRSSPTIRFMIGIVAYWEAISSFHIDQEPSAVDYLFPFCDWVQSQGSQPHPWTGISMPLFIYMAQVGSITRQERLVHRIRTEPSSDDTKRTFRAALLRSAKAVIGNVQRYKIPPTEQFEETCDTQTPLQHFQTIAQIYQLSIILELYRVFPELVEDGKDILCDAGGIPIAVSTTESPSRRFGALVALAINILSLLSSLPETSGTRAIQLPALIIAGSALQYLNEEETSILPETGNVYQGVAALFSNKAVVLHWRTVVIERLKMLDRYVGLDSVDRGIKIIEHVWLKADILAERKQGSTVQNITMVHWVDVMWDMKLETLLG